LIEIFHTILFQSKIFCPSSTRNGNKLNIAIQGLNDAPAYEYQLDLTNMKGVMGAHIHSGKAGENGPPIAGLFNAEMTGPPTGAVNGPLTKGTIKSADLQGPLAGKHISDQVKLLKNGGKCSHIPKSKWRDLWRRIILNKLFSVNNDIIFGLLA
jgi:hypothetical protein